jgi:hypothetical protein
MLALPPCAHLGKIELCTMEDAIMHVIYFVNKIDNMHIIFFFHFALQSDQAK